jgi:hypothetical protein
MKKVVEVILKWASAFVFVFLAGIASNALWTVFMIGWNLLLSIKGY